LILAVLNGLPYARLGLAVSKKHVRKSVNRNRIKRMARESFRHHQSEILGLDLLVITYKGSEMLSNKQIRLSLEDHWHRLIQCKDS
jgi:ribonuclease P protein component